MAKPTLIDYVQLIFTLFDMFAQQQSPQPKRDRPFTFTEKAMIALFTLLQFWRIYPFKAQWRWLTGHPEMLTLLGLAQVPHRTTLPRRYKQLYETLQAFMRFISQFGRST